MRPGDPIAAAALKSGTAAHYKEHVPEPALYIATVGTTEHTDSPPRWGA